MCVCRRIWLSLANHIPFVQNMEYILFIKKNFDIRVGGFESWIFPLKTSVSVD